MQRNYGYLETYQGGNPRDYLSDVSDPYVLQYYATELNHAMKRALYCVVSQSSIKSPNIIFPPSRKRKFSGSPGGRKKSFFFPLLFECTHTYTQRPQPIDRVLQETRIFKLSFFCKVRGKSDPSESLSRAHRISENHSTQTQIAKSRHRFVSPLQIYILDNMKTQKDFSK